MSRLHQSPPLVQLQSVTSAARERPPTPACDWSTQPSIILHLPLPQRSVARTLLNTIQSRSPLLFDLKKITSDCLHVAELQLLLSRRLVIDIFLCVCVWGSSSLHFDPVTSRSLIATLSEFLSLLARVKVGRS